MRLVPRWLVIMLFLDGAMGSEGVIYISDEDDRERAVAVVDLTGENESDRLANFGLDFSGLTRTISLWFAEERRERDEELREHKRIRTQLDDSWLDDFYPDAVIADVADGTHPAVPLRDPVLTNETRSLVGVDVNVPVLADILEEPMVLPRVLNQQEEAVCVEYASVLTELDFFRTTRNYRLKVDMHGEIGDGSREQKSQLVVRIVALNDRRKVLEDLALWGDACQRICIRGLLIKF